MAQEDVQAQLAQLTQTQFLSTLVTKITDQCFSKCIKKPRHNLETGEQTCLGSCMDTYLQVMQEVEKEFVNNVQKQAKLIQAVLS
jgi:import inner membrane translocase subunit TIM13